MQRFSKGDLEIVAKPIWNKKKGLSVSITHHSCSGWEQSDNILAVLELSLFWIELGTTLVQFIRTTATEQSSRY